MSIWLAALLLALIATGASAETLTAPSDAPLQNIIDLAATGDVIEIAPGERHGNFVVGRPMTLSGAEGAVLDGDGKGSVLRVAAPDVTIAGLSIRNSGRDHETMDAGVFLEATARRALVRDNRLKDNLFGVYVHGASGATVRGNEIEGLTGGRRNEAGNAVTVWNAPDATIARNLIRGGRDGVFVLASPRDRFVANRFENLRFAVHYMYAQDGEIADNVSIGNDAGFALMFSNNLVVRGNRSAHDRDYGFLLNFANRSRVIENIVEAGPLSPGQRRGVSAPDSEHAALEREYPDIADHGPGKCLFIYNANRNIFAGNWFSGCDIGVHFTAGSQGNEIYNNAFVGNRTQVKYIGTRRHEWSLDGRGNYWSGALAFDLDGDGAADEAYQPNDIVDQALWRAPPAKLLLASPALTLLRWAQRQFPAIFPGGVVDSHPLMTPPPRPATGEGAP